MILAIAVFARVMRDSDNAQIWHHTRVMALSYFLGDPAKATFNAQRDHFRSSYEVGTWAEACNWLLRIYATISAISRRVSELGEVRQKLNGTEDFSSRLRGAVTRCGDVRFPYEMTIIFIQGLLPP